MPTTAGSTLAVTADDDGALIISADDDGALRSWRLDGTPGPLQAPDAHNRRGVGGRRG
jgi:hypothetical protein